MPYFIVHIWRGELNINELLLSIFSELHKYKECCPLIMTIGSFPLIYMEPRFQDILLHVSFQYGIKHF